MGIISVPVVDGSAQTNTTPTTAKEDTKGTNSLGKDAFLQLLVAQLQYQDPLEPQSNQEFIGELTQFSTLEELQNVTSTLSNSNTLSLVGKNVILEIPATEGMSAATIGGYVEYVQMVNGKANLSINGNLYSAEYLDKVIDEEFLAGVLGQGPNGNNKPDGTETETDKEPETKTE